MHIFSVWFVHNLSAWFLSFFVLFGVLCFCGVVLYNYQLKDMERMVIEMMYRQDIENEVVDCIRNSGERVVDYGIDAIEDCLVVM